MSDISEATAEQIAGVLRDALVGALNTPDILDGLLRPYVESLIRSGELVPRARVQVGTSVELCPAGMEQATRALYEALRELDELPEPLRDPLKALAVILEGELEQLEVAVVDEAAPVADLEVDVEIAEPDDDETADTVAEDLLCEECSAVITADQALKSYTRWRRNLCDDDFEKEGARRKARKKEDPDA